MDYIPLFNVQVRVHRSFSFEELQSGAYFNSLDDESDLQFYCVHSQPVLIPGQDDDADYSLHDSYQGCENSLHVACPSVYSHKSYTLQDALGEERARSHTTQLTRPSPDWYPIKQEPIEVLPNPALPAVASRLCTLLDFDGTGMETPICLPDQPMHGEPPMESRPFPPPSSTSPPYFQTSPQSQSTSEDAFHNTSRDQWEGVSPHLFVPSQLHMVSELPSLAPPASLPQQYPSSGSVTRSHRRRSRSLSSPLRMSPAPHLKWSQDKKPALACLFCRERKIACGPPQPGSKDNTCNQCARRHLKCEYPLESRRGKRKRRSLIPCTPEINPDGPRVCIVKANRQQSVDKAS